MVVSLNKGKDLEAGVAAIENLIIEHTPAFKKSKIKFIRNKILTCKGVKHEIDLYVEINPGSDYKSLFIFECKNRKKPIGKEPVLSFISKISDLNAQCGFFIAKSYTKSAKALASRNTRVKLLRFDDTI